MQPDQTLSSQAPFAKQYIAKLTQASTEPPTATIFKNTLGAVPLWEYDSTGVYTLTLEGAFPFAKTHVLITGNAGETIWGDWDMPDAIYISTRDSSGAPANNQMSSGSIIINVYQ